METLSPTHARRITLHAQKLPGSTLSKKGKEGIAALIQHLGYIQIDSISVIERAHHHTLWTRSPKYAPEMIDGLLEEKRIFEYWAHAAAYLPMSHYRYYLPLMRAIAKGEVNWGQPDKQVKQYVLDRIKAEGPLQAKDFKESRKKKITGWWDWKPAKRALEQLFMEGKLMVTKRHHFQKVYDLTKRVLPEKIERTPPKKSELIEFLIRQAITSQGLIRTRELSHFKKDIRTGIKEGIQNLLDKKVIVPVQVTSLPNEVFYLFPETLQKRVPKTRSQKVSLLSPFDNAVIQRERLQKLFGFDYTIECYLPPQKRKYGYFTLPILWGEKFVGRMDSKADRQQGKFLVKNIAFEPHFKKSSEFFISLSKVLHRFSQFNKCRHIELAPSIAATDRKKILSE